MSSQLISLGLVGSSLKLPDGVVFDGEILQKVTALIQSLDEPLLTLDRRGIDLRILAAKHLNERGLLPRYRAVIGEF
jgi:hypothetical protein